MGKWEGLTVVLLHGVGEFGPSVSATSIMYTIYISVVVARIHKCWFMS